jgi:hypothetical protein
MADTLQKLTLRSPPCAGQPNMPNSKTDNKASHPRAHGAAAYYIFYMWANPRRANRGAPHGTGVTPTSTRAANSAANYRPRRHLT